MSSLTEDAMPDFHDATLESVSTDWGKRSTTIQLKTNEGSLDIRLLGIQKIQIDYLEPWGPSQSVNLIRILETGQLEMEMQTGDKLLFEAQSYALNQSGYKPGDA